MPVIIPLLLAAQAPVATAGTGCVQLMTGSWAGSGIVGGFGPPMKVAARATYRTDGSFASTTRFTGRDGRPQEQSLSGRWSVKAGRQPGTCTIELSSESAGGSSSSSSEVRFVDRDTYRALGVDMHRVQSR